MEPTFKTPYCHMVEESSKQKKIKVRQQIVKFAQRRGNKPAARYFGCSKNTVKLWRRRFERGGTGALLDQKNGPNNIPHKTPNEMEDLIIKCRKSAPCYGPKRLKWAYEEIKASESAIARILKQNNLTRKRRKKYQRKQDLRKVKAKYKALTHHQEDLKHLYDIPHYWEQIFRKGLPKYQWTLRCTKSGMQVLAYANEYSELYSTILTKKYLQHLENNGVDLREVIIQTDNGSEFGGAKRDFKQPGLIHMIEIELGAKHNFIPPNMSNANADVESVHASIEDEFFNLETFASKGEFFLKATAYQWFYNMIRPNHSKKGKTPWQIIEEDRPGISPEVLMFPVLDLDKEFRKIYDHNPEKSDIAGGQTLPKLPENRERIMEN
ncbi:MAG: helix-turn-helix domain-containing protein [bacterium]